MGSGNQFFPNVTLTDDIYRASKPDAVQELYKLEPGDARDSLAQQLAQQGYLIDVPIDVWNWDPVTTMAVRKQMGSTWEPSALMQPLNGAIGAGPVPLGAIKVSTNAVDYPPFDPPAPPAVQGTNLVGWLVFGKIFTYGPGAIVGGKIVVTDGQQVTQDGVTYTAHVKAGSMLGMGTTVYFEKAA